MKKIGVFVKIFTSLITLPILASLIKYKNIYLVGSDLDHSGYFYSDINLKNIDIDKYSSIKVLNQLDFRSDKNFNSHKSNIKHLILHIIYLIIFLFLLIIANKMVPK